MYSLISCSATIAACRLRRCTFVFWSMSITRDVHCRKLYLRDESAFTKGDLGGATKHILLRRLLNRTSSENTPWSPSDRTPYLIWIPRSNFKPFFTSQGGYTSGVHSLAHYCPMMCLHSKYYGTPGRGMCRVFTVNLEYQYKHCEICPGIIVCRPLNGRRCEGRGGAC